MGSIGRVSKILVMGLPGSGKTRMAQSLVSRINLRGKSVVWFNADEIRTQFNDWDFSIQGRLRQAERMRSLVENTEADYGICDFVAPTDNVRKAFGADYTIWMDTICKGRFEDTNQVFTPPQLYDFHIREKDCEKWSEFIIERIKV